MLAALEAEPEVGGREALTALAVGVEVFCRLGVACYNSLGKGWHPTTALGTAAATVEQQVLAAYIRKGLFEAHIRRIRGVYSERRMALLAAIERELSGRVVLQPSNHGMHVVLWLPPGLDDVEVARRALEAGVVVRPVSTMYSAAPARSGLMLGFGGFTPDQIDAAITKLKGVLGR